MSDAIDLVELLRKIGIRACYRARPLRDLSRRSRQLFDGIGDPCEGAALTDMDWAMSGRWE